RCRLQREHWTKCNLAAAAERMPGHWHDPGRRKERIAIALGGSLLLRVRNERLAMQHELPTVMRTHPHGHGRARGLYARAGRTVLLNRLDQRVRGHDTLTVRSGSGN